MVATNSGSIKGCYFTGKVDGYYAGGLVRYNDGFIAASYSIGNVTTPDVDSACVGGLVCLHNGLGPIVDSYWNTETAGQQAPMDKWGKTTADLKTPTSYNGIYANWNVDLDEEEDTDGTPDDPWHFGSGDQYPALQVDFDGNGTATWQEFGEQPIRSMDGR